MKNVLLNWDHDVNPTTEQDVIHNLVVEMKRNNFGAVAKEDRLEFFQIMGYVSGGFVPGLNKVSDLKDAGGFGMWFGRFTNNAFIQTMEDTFYHALATVRGE